MPPAKLALVAIGGNSLIKNQNRKSIQDQRVAERETCEKLAELISLGFQLVITHGNGPQVGFIMHRAEVAQKIAGIHGISLELAVADSVGAIGHCLETELNNSLRKRGLQPKCVVILTQVRIDANDPGLKDPTKPIGGFYASSEIKKVKLENPDWVLKEEPGRGWRRVVPSPEPQAIVEEEAIKSVLDAGFHVIAGGGGGLPMVPKDGGLSGIDGVIDKDLTSSLMASRLGAELFIISTAVEQVAINFGKPNQQCLGTINVDQAKQYIAEGHFGAGSMLPKIEAALRFLNQGGQEVVITNPENLLAAIRENAGTHIRP